jgi:hypothetical protein
MTAREGPARKRPQLASEIYRARLNLTCFYSLSFGIEGLGMGGRFAGIPYGRAVAKIVCVAARSSDWGLRDTLVQYAACLDPIFLVCANG